MDGHRLFLFDKLTKTILWSLIIVQQSKYYKKSSKQAVCSQFQTKLKVACLNYHSVKHFIGEISESFLLVLVVNTNLIFALIHLSKCLGLNKSNVLVELWLSNNGSLHPVQVSEVVRSWWMGQRFQNRKLGVVIVLLLVSS